MEVLPVYQDVWTFVKYFAKIQYVIFESLEIFTWGSAMAPSTLLNLLKISWKNQWTSPSFLKICINSEYVHKVSGKLSELVNLLVNL